MLRAYFKGAIWICCSAFARHAASKRGSLGESVGRKAWAMSTLGPVLGAVRRLWANAHALALPAGRLVARFTSLATAGTLFSESARAFALGEYNGSPACAESATLSVTAATAATRRCFSVFIAVLSVVLAVVAAGWLLFTTFVDTPRPRESLKFLDDSLQRSDFNRWLDMQKLRMFFQESRAVGQCLVFRQLAQPFAFAGVPRQ